MAHFGHCYIARSPCLLCVAYRDADKPVEAEDRVGSLKVITSYSIFRSEAAMVKKFDELQGHPTGTLIIIYDLKLQK